MAPKVTEFSHHKLITLKFYCCHNNGLYLKHHFAALAK